MLFGNLQTEKASGFSDVRCYWSPEAVERATNWKPEGDAKDEFIHLINSGSTCLNATGAKAFRDVYSVMANWGANHGAFVHGRVSRSDHTGLHAPHCCHDAQCAGRSDLPSACMDILRDERSGSR